MADESLPFTDAELQAERWLSAVGFPFYQVSDLGRVRSISRCVPIAPFVRDGHLIEMVRPLPGVMLSPIMRPDGRTFVSVGRAGRRFIHVLVLTAFVGPRPPKMEGCHNDGNPAHNRLSNLRWDTRSGNMKDMVRHGTFKRPDPPLGEMHGNSVLTREQVMEIRGDSRTHQVIANDFGITRSNVGAIKNRLSWRHVP